MAEKSLKPFWRGVLETAAVLAAFLGFGLAWAGLESARTATPYAPNGMEEATRPAPVWLVDGYNVLCTGLLGGHDRSDWWSEARREELLALLARFEGLDGVDEADAEIWVVFDGAREPSGTGEREGPVRVVFASSADEWLIERVRAHAEVAVVTADRKLAGRARHRGARVVSPREFLRRCKGYPPGGERAC